MLIVGVYVRRRRANLTHEKDTFYCLTESGHHQVHYSTPAKYPKARDFLHRRDTLGGTESRDVICNARRRD